MRAGGFDLAMPAMISAGGMLTVADQPGLARARFAFARRRNRGARPRLGSGTPCLAPRLGRAVILATLASGGVLQALAVGLMVWLPTGFAPLVLTAWIAETWLGLPGRSGSLPAAGALGVLLDRLRDQRASSPMSRP